MTRRHAIAKLDHAYAYLLTTGIDNAHSPAEIRAVMQAMAIISHATV